MDEETEDLCQEVTGQAAKAGYDYVSGHSYESIFVPGTWKIQVLLFFSKYFWSVVWFFSEFLYIKLVVGGLTCVIMSVSIV